MEKAYDLKALGEKLKAKGLVVAEDAAEQVYEEVKAWFEESAKLSETPYDDMALIVLPQIDILVKKQLDKIDGQEG